MGPILPPLSPDFNAGSTGDIVCSELPDWAARELLAEAVKAVGLPWVPGAAWQRPREVWMTLTERLAAVNIAGRVIAEARGLLPAGAGVDRQFRDAAWRCTVAGLALLDADGWNRLAGIEPELRTDPAAIYRPSPRNAPPAPRPEHAPRFTIRRRGEEAAHV